MSKIYFNLYQISQILEEENGACCAEFGEGLGDDGMLASCFHTADTGKDCDATSPAWPIPLPLCAA